MGTSSAIISRLATATTENIHDDRRPLFHLVFSPSLGGEVGKVGSDEMRGGHDYHGQAQNTQRASNKFNDDIIVDTH